jgi:hypothetical protein
MLARSLLRRLLAVCFLSAALVRPAFAVEWTDIWWNPNESGQGYNFIQSDTFIFATFFVYGPNNEPIWYTGQMTVDSNGVWSGPLYQTTGSYFGAPWNPAQRTTTQVGTVTFAPSSSVTGTLTYNVNNVNVSKQIQRQTLTTIPLGGNYSGAILSVFSNCNDPSQNGSVRVFVDFTVAQTVSAGTLQINMTNSGGACTFAGPYNQVGQLYSIPNAAYTCGSLAFTAQVSQIKSTNQGFEGQWTAPVGSGCIESGYWSAVFLN